MFSTHHNLQTNWVAKPEPTSLTGLFVLLAVLLSAAPGLAQTTAPVVKVLAAAEDATQKTVLIGRASAGNMLVIFELEAAKGMWMPMGKPSKWVEHPVAKGEVFHVEVKPVDPKSKTRIAYADVKFSIINRDNKKQVSGALHPMWGGSGLHYAANSPLAGDGRYEATITVGAPTFGRAPADKDLWTKPITAKFHFKLAGSKLIEVTEPSLSRFLCARHSMTTRSMNATQDQDRCGGPGGAAADSG